MPADHHALGNPARLAALQRLGLLDTASEQVFDRLTKLAAEVLGVPVCLVSLVDEHRQFFKSAYGLSGAVGEARETPLTHSFCQHVVAAGAPLVVTNAPENPLVCRNLAIRDLGVMAYLGVPIRSPEGFVLGSFCVIDSQPHPWSTQEIEWVHEFTALVETEIRLRAALLDKQEALARHQAVLDGTHYSVIATSPEGMIEVFNIGAERMLGYTAAEMVGRQTPAVIHLRQEVEERAAALSATLGRWIEPGFEVFVALPRLGQADEREWTYVRKDGVHLTVRLNITALRNAEGVITGFLGIAQDITERKQASLALEATRGQLEKIFSAMSEGLVLQAAGGEILECNRAAETILGLTRDQLMGRSSLDPLWRCVRGDGTPFPGGEHPAMQTLRTGAPCRDVLMGVHHADGKLVWIEINTELIGRPEEAGRQVACSFRDVTARRRSEERFRTFAQLAPVGIYQTDISGGCEYVNPAWSALTGMDLTEAAGDGWVKALHPEDRAPLFTQWLAFAEGVEKFSHEYRFRRPDGTITWVSGAAAELRDAAGRLTGYIGTIMDITAQKQLEMSLALARDKALDASRLKSEFLANMSHEIRTPMNGVIGMTGLLLDSGLTDEQAEMARLVQTSAESLLTIINDILDFSKIEAGKMQVEEGDFSLHSLVEETIALLGPRAHGKNVALVCDFEAAVKGLWRGDGGRVRQVLTNLLGNAIKFTERGEVRVGVRLLPEKGEHWVRCEVRDTGIGIPEDQRGLLFQPFMQVDGTATRRFGGTGLGLAISQQLVRLMGGEIGVSSEPGRGSVFWFDLPLGVAEPDKLTLAAEPQVLPVVGPALGARRRVLLVEDNEVNQIVAQGLLEKMGYDVVIASNGQEAVAVCRQQAFAVVLMDCQMPVMDGYSATRALRAEEASTRTTRRLIIALTAYAMPYDREKCLLAGMDDYVTKPLRGSELAGVLARHGLGVESTGREVRG